jgi:hypothetical protein
MSPDFSSPSRGISASQTGHSISFVFIDSILSLRMLLLFDISRKKSRRIFEGSEKLQDALLRFLDFFRNRNLSVTR